MSGSSIEALDLAALLCSRVCHDLISPVGAIVNGLEVLEEGKDEETKKFAGEGGEGGRGGLPGPGRLFRHARRPRRAPFFFALLCRASLFPRSGPPLSFSHRPPLPPLLPSAAGPAPGLLPPPPSHQFTSLLILRLPLCRRSLPPTGTVAASLGRLTPAHVVAYDLDDALIRVLEVYAASHC